MSKLRESSGWNDRFAIDKVEVKKGAKPVRKKTYIAMNGSEVKATIDTGPSKLRKKVKAKTSTKPKVSSPVQSKTKYISHNRKLSMEV